MRSVSKVKNRWIYYRRDGSFYVLSHPRTPKLPKPKVRKPKKPRVRKKRTLAVIQSRKHTRFRQQPWCGDQNTFHLGDLEIWYKGQFSGSTPYQASNVSKLNLSGSESGCLDEAPHLKRGGVYHEGGPFALCKYERKARMWRGTARGYQGSIEYKYVGKAYCLNFTPPGWTTWYSLTSLPQIDSMVDGDAYGATAWNRFKPGKPKASLSVFLGELREMNPHALMSQAKEFSRLARGQDFTRSAANTYLAGQMGWVPFVSDLRKMYTLSRNIEQELHAISRSYGKSYKRSGVVWDDTRSRSYDGLDMTLISGMNSIIAPTSSYRTRVTDELVRRVWFSARFRILMPSMKVGSPKWRKNTIRKLFGGTITPGDVYELLPWSWLIDWYTNLGDVISNLSVGTVDFAAEYAYIMSSAQYVRRQESFAGSASASLTIEVSTKYRAAANPFGFGIPESNHTPRQLAILSALGIQRMR